MTTTHESVKVFFSYSHKDEAFLNELKTSLAGLRRAWIIEEWHDRKIFPGEEWEKVIDENLKAADIILLVSPDFVDSDYAYDKEMYQALEKHELEEARVIPIIIRPTYWKRAPFGKLQVLPKDAKPINRWLDRDEAWLDVVEGIARAVDELTAQRAERPQQVETKAEPEQSTIPPQEVPRDSKDEERPTYTASRLSSVCPYHGLNAFTEEDAEFFFGRWRVVRECLDELRRELSFLTVLGPSGSGKSSIIRAGLIPELRRGKVLGIKRWGVVITRRYDDPFEQLATAGPGLTQKGRLLR